MTLNEAILVVIKTQFKKDMGEALKIVENAGYEVSKWDGRFYVKNRSTKKEVCLREWYRGYTVNGNGYVKCKFTYDGVCHMDFVGYLEKPANLTWWEVQSKRADWRSDTWYKYNRLRSVRNSIKYTEDNINRVRKQITDLQKTLERDIEYRVRREQDLVAIRKELGLI